MTEKLALTSEQEARKEAWLGELADFIIEANVETWAADKGEVPADQVQRPGYKEHTYVRGAWELRDSFSGYFKAPGMTTVYYNNRPAWTMVYGGSGMEPSGYEIVKPTFVFLREALKKVTRDLPFRGPRKFVDGDMLYEMDVTGDVEDFEGSEKVSKAGKKTFTQLFFGGVIIDKDSNRNPVYPWDLH